MTRLVLTIWLCSWAIPAYAQFKLPNGQAPSKTVRRDPKTGANFRAWLAVEGYQPRYEFIPSPKVVPGVRSLFMQEFAVCADHQDTATNREYRLLAKAEENGAVKEIFGWVESELTVPDNRPLLNLADGWYKKLRVVNTPQSIHRDLTAVSAAEASTAFKTVAATKAPGGDVGKKENVQTFKVSNLFFVYAETKEHVLIGSADYFDPQNPLEVIKGWIPQDRISRWEHRLAVEWNRDSTLASAKPRRRTEPGFLIAVPTKDGSLDDTQSQELAQQFREGKITQAELEKNAAIAFPEQFDKDGVSVRWSSARPRNPILQHLPERITQNDLLKVGWLGGEVGGIDLEKLNRRLKEAREEAKQLDVLVVIDHTTSMEKYFPVVAQAVAGLFLDVQQRARVNRRDMRVSVCYYGDEDESAIPFESNPFASLMIADPKVDAVTASYLQQYIEFMRQFSVRGGTRDEADFFSKTPFPLNENQVPAVIKLIREVHHHRNQEGGDARESVFEGIKRAIKGTNAAGFRPGIQHLVVVIGDMGDKSGEGDLSDAVPGNKVDRQFTLRQSVVEALFPPDAFPRELLVIHTEARKPNGGQRHPDAELFEIQLKSIAELANARIRREFPPLEGEAAETPATFVSSSELGKIRAFLESRYQEIIARSEAIERQIRLLQQGQWDMWNKAIGPAVRRTLDSKGINEQELRKVTGAEVYQEGYVWLYPPGSRVPLVRQKVMLNDDEVFDIIKILEGVVGDKVRNQRNKSLGQLAYEVIDATLGEDGGGKTRQEKEQARLKLPFKSKLLRTPVEQLRDLVLNDEPQLKDELRLKLAMLKDLREGKKHDWFLKEIVGDSGVKDTKLAWSKEEEFPRHFEIPGDPGSKHWYWADLETEMP